MSDAPQTVVDMTDPYQERTLAIVPECPEAGPVDSFTAALLTRSIARKKMGCTTDDAEAAFRVPFNVRSRAQDSLGKLAGDDAFKAGMSAALEGEDVSEIEKTAWNAAYHGRENGLHAHPNVRSNPAPA